MRASSTRSATGAAPIVTSLPLQVLPELGGSSARAVHAVSLCERPRANTAPPVGG
jgi:hypothetical protein